MHHRTGLRAEVQGRIQETVLLDAGERKVPLIFLKGEELEERGCMAVFSVFVIQSLI